MVTEADAAPTTPHAIGWTDESSRIGGRRAAEAALSVAAGRVPEHLVNPEVLERSAFVQKLQRRGSVPRA